ncbi:MAG: O-antigen ligase domain-containing protein [Sphingobacteriales bacterium]|nr:MAG: O-antigen ligase domain-containing protein [Sphingobacteriales bacterium]
MSLELELTFDKEVRYAKSMQFWQFAILVLLAIACSISEILIAVCWSFIFITTIVAFAKNDTSNVWYCIAASPAMEVWARMSRAPMVPDEIGKYYLVLATTVLLLHNLRNKVHFPAHRAGKILLLVLLPSVVVHLATFNYDRWVFNGLGMIELVLLLSLTAIERWDVEKFCKALQYAFYPIIGMLVFTTMKTPTYDNIDFRLNANNTGGFGSNQVATLLGVGILLLTILMVLKRPFVSFKPLNYLLIAYLLFKGMLTFSRGGMFVPAVAVIVMFLPGMMTNARSFLRYTLLLVALFVTGFLVFQKVNSMTGNNLLYRYRGETRGTLDRTKEKSWNSVTSGRVDIVASDWMIFKDNPIFGVGIGNSGPERYKYGVEPIVAHTEFSRMLSEQGIWGAGTAIGLLAFAFAWVLRQRLNTWRGVTGALFTLAILTTFHAAMRTNTASVFYALAAIPVYYRKQEQGDEEE